MTPAINKLEPTSGAVGSPITIFGQNFGNEQGDNLVSVNGVRVTDYGDTSDYDAATRNAWALGASTQSELAARPEGQKAADNVDVGRSNASGALPNTPAGPKGPAEVGSTDANAPKQEGKPVV